LTSKNDRPWTLKVKSGARNEPIEIDSGAIRLFEIQKIASDAEN